LSKELNITAAAGMTPATFAAATKLLTDSTIDTNTLIDQIINLDDIPSVLERMNRGSAGKVFVQPR
jgi:threonine dehydrogenase-like Zn-dependent dehydrogenase